LRNERAEWNPHEYEKVSSAIEEIDRAKEEDG
jgi:hypothetical protein